VSGASDDRNNHRHVPRTGCRNKGKARTYRRKARKQYLAVAKKKKPRMEAIRWAPRQQLQYVRRNLETIRSRYGSDLTRLSRYQYQSLLVVSEIYRQQRKMYDEKTHSVPGRIVNLSQPHVRPIVGERRQPPLSSVRRSRRQKLSTVHHRAFLITPEGQDPVFVQSLW
jgi:transposase, IS5 family